MTRPPTLWDVLKMLLAAHPTPCLEQEDHKSQQHFGSLPTLGGDTHEDQRSRDPVF